MLALLTIARNTFVESLRQPIVLIMVVLTGVLQYLNTAISAYSMGYRRVPGEITGDDKVLFDIGLATVFLMGMVLAAFVATSAISREIENKTVLTVVSKPISRAAVVGGKFLGVGATMVLAVIPMILYLLFGLRHGVMSTAGDTIDWPTLVFALSPLLIAGGAGAFANFFYGWSFPQTTLVVLVPLTMAGYGASLVVGEGWQLQPPTESIKPQVLIASAALAIAVLVMSAVAVAASTRLGQVMTIVVSAGVFVLGLLSNHLLARHAFTGSPYAFVESVTPDAPRFEGLDEPGDRYTVVLAGKPDAELERGRPFRYGPSPEGAGMVTPAFPAVSEGTDLSRDVFPPEMPPALVITAVDGLRLTVKHVGGRPLEFRRPPRPGDWCFVEHPRIRWPALVVWSVIPNMQAFWLVDAVTQVRDIPASHLGLVALYGGFQIVGLFALSVLLFQGRDVG
mgnify:FL=1